MRFSNSIFIVTLFALVLAIIGWQSCTKGNRPEDVVTWTTEDDQASGLRNGKSWSGEVTMAVKDNTMTLSVVKRDADSVVREIILANFIALKSGPQKLGQEWSPERKIYSEYWLGYDDEFNTYNIDSTQLNEIELKNYDLQEGIIKAKLNATYIFYYPLDQLWDTVQFKNVEITYRR
jgi:hypothetical protein